MFRCTCISTQQCGQPISYRLLHSHGLVAIHWNGNVVILTKSSSLAALKVVKMTTFSAASDEDFVKATTFSFQCRTTSEVWSRPTVVAAFVIGWSKLLNVDWVKTRLQWILICNALWGRWKPRLIFQDNDNPNVHTVTLVKETVKESVSTCLSAVHSR